MAGGERYYAPAVYEKPVEERLREAVTNGQMSTLEAMGYMAIYLKFLRGEQDNEPELSDMLPTT